MNDPKLFNRLYGFLADIPFDHRHGEWRRARYIVGDMQLILLLDLSNTSSYIKVLLPGRCHRFWWIRFRGAREAKWCREPTDADRVEIMLRLSE